MKLTDFKKIKLEHGDPIFIYWDDIVSFTNYEYKPDMPVDKQLGRFAIMGWFIKIDKDKMSIAHEVESPIAKHLIGEHPFRVVQTYSVGDIYSIAKLPKPKKWYY